MCSIRVIVHCASQKECIYEKGVINYLAQSSLMAEGFFPLEQSNLVQCGHSNFCPKCDFY